MLSAQGTDLRIISTKGRSFFQRLSIAWSENMSFSRYLRLIVVEALRLYPQPPLLIRRALKRDKLPGIPFHPFHTIQNFTFEFCRFLLNETKRKLICFSPELICCGIGPALVLLRIAENFSILFIIELVWIRVH